MKLVIISGATRKNGNTAAILKELARGFDDVRSFDLYSMDIKGCSGCLYCKSHDGCSIKDDMTPIYEAIEEADALIIGSPIYMCEETACTKAFIERTFAFLDNKNRDGGRPIYVPKLRPGKKAVAMFLSGSPLGRRQFRTVTKNYEQHFKTQGFKDSRTFILAGVHPGMDALKETKVIKTIAKARSFLQDEGQ